MATLIENHVTLEVVLTLDTAGGKHAFLRGDTFDAAGDKLRSFDQVEVTTLLTPAQQKMGSDLIDAAVAYMKAQFGIA